MASYCVVYFEPIAGDSRRIAVAAIVYKGTRRCAFVLAEEQPSPEETGVAAHSVLRYGINVLKFSENIMGIPSVVGDQFVLGKEEPISDWTDLPQRLRSYDVAT